MVPLKPIQDTGVESPSFRWMGLAGTPEAKAEEHVPSPGTPIRKQNTKFKKTVKGKGGGGETTASQINNCNRKQ